MIICRESKQTHDLSLSRPRVIETASEVQCPRLCWPPESTQTAGPTILPSAISLCSSAVLLLGHRGNLLSLLYPISMIEGYGVDPQAAPLVGRTKAPEQSIDTRYDPQMRSIPHDTLLPSSVRARDRARRRRLQSNSHYDLNDGAG